MKLVNLMSDPADLGPCVVALGTFDGVHLGHRALIRRLLAEAKSCSLPAVIFTFDHSPRRILNPNDFPGELTTPEEKFGLLLGSGVDRVVFRPFDREFARTSPSEFIHGIICGKLRARVVCVGFNFGFGLQREGSADFLAGELRNLDIPCRVVEPVKRGKHIVSSTLIREAIGDGDFALANDLLGREATFSGVVIHGDHRGRTMGFPTANLDLTQTSKVLPPRGVYFCKVDTHSGTFHAITNIGVRPTFDKDRPLLETHLLDFNGDLYHTTIRVRFFKKIRDEIRFPTPGDLVTRLNQDLDEARRLIGSEGKAEAQ